MRTLRWLESDDIGSNKDPEWQSSIDFKRMWVARLEGLLRQSKREERMMAWTSAVAEEVERSCQILDIFWRKRGQDSLMDWLFSERSKSLSVQDFWLKHLEEWRFHLLGESRCVRAMGWSAKSKFGFGHLTLRHLSGSQVKTSTSS